MTHLILVILAAQMFPSKPAVIPPLKCGEYQHQQFIPAHCANTCPAYGNACTTECRWTPEENRCVDDMHEVTEREWQSIVQSIRHYILDKPMSRA